MNFERPNISDNLIVESWDLEDREVFFVLDPDKPSWAFINKDSLEILNLCNGKNAILDISKKIAEKYLIDQKEAFNTVKSFLNNMAEIKVVHYNGTEGESQVPTSGNSFRSMAIEITKKCNLRCVHCFLSAGSAAEG